MLQEVVEEEDLLEDGGVDSNCWMSCIASCSSADRDRDEDTDGSGGIGGEVVVLENMIIYFVVTDRIVFVNQLFYYIIMTAAVQIYRPR